MIGCVASGGVLVGAVLSVKLKVSASSAPLADAVNTGFAAPYPRLAFPAVTVRVAWPTVKVPTTHTTIPVTRLSPVATAAFTYVPTGELVVAAVLSVKLNVSPFTAPLADAV